MTASIGYDNIVRQRNQQQAEYLSDQCAQDAPELFSATMAKKQPKKRRAADIRTLRACPESLSLTINGHGEDWELEVLRPVHARAELAVPLEADVFTKLISYIQHAGFSEDLQQCNKKRRSLPDQAPGGILTRTAPGMVSRST